MNLDLLIVGSGGNGQSYFMKVLENKFKINSPGDKDGLKHLPSPNSPKLKKYKIKKCIFLYNDSFKAICSHFRRKWAFSQINKLGNIYHLKKYQMKNINAFLQLANKHPGKDLYSIDYQFTNWYKQHTSFPIYFCNFSQINLPELAKFLKCPISYLNFTIKERGDYSDIDKKYQRVKIMYEKMDKDIDKLSKEKNKKLSLQ